MKSWIEVNSESHFSLQNLPIGVFSSPSNSHPRAGVAIGEFVLDMIVLHQFGLLNGLGFDSSIFGLQTLNEFMSLERKEWRATRLRLQDLLVEDGDDRLRSNEELKRSALIPLDTVTMHMPAAIGDYTDFYSSREHATNVGIMFRGIDNALQPNWLHLPVGYHGRASSIVISGTDITRPSGQVQKNKDEPKEGSIFSPCRLLDYELEMAFFVGGSSNPLGRPLTMEEAEDRIFGVVLMNDWSARDIQAWEYVPLGPFTAKNFATSISPWIVSLDALEPFRCHSSTGPVQSDPVPLPYLIDPNYSIGAYDIKLEVAALPPGETTPSPITRSNFRHMYWNMKQQLVHHSVTGCPMVAGDLLGSGTISGTDQTAFGSMLELSWRGAKEIPLVNSPNNEVRKFLKDGDTVIITGFSEAGDGSYRIGFGEVSGRILPAGTVSTKPTLPHSASKPVHSGFSNFKLYSYYRSTSSWRVRIALALKGIEYETIPIDLAKLVGNTTELLPEDFRSMNPLAQVPVLEFTDSQGQVIRLTQSMAILDFLEEISPNPPILPANPLTRARAKQIAEIVNSGIQPLQNLAILRQVKDVELIGSGEICGEHTDGRGFAKCNMEKGLASLEVLVASLGGGVNGLYAAGTVSPTIADLSLIPQIYNAVRFNIDLSKYPHLVAVNSLAVTNPAFVAASPESQVDFRP